MPTKHYLTDLFAIVELIKPSILEQEKLDSTGPSMLVSKKAISINQKWLTRCNDMAKVIEEFLLTNKLLRKHKDFTEDEKAVHAMNVESRSSNGESLGYFKTKEANKGGTALYTLFRMIYDYIHTFGQDLQSMYTALCITGENIHGELAYHQQLEIQHNTHLPNQINGTEIIGTRDCNPKNTSLAPHYINTSSYYCSQHADKECSCMAGKLYKKCHPRLHQLTRDFYIQSVRFIQIDHLGPLVREKDDGSGFIPYTTMEVCQHQLNSIKEAFTRHNGTNKPLPEWINTEQDRLDRGEEPEEVQNLVSDARQRAYERDGFPTPPDLNAIVFGGETTSNNAFGNRLDQQCKLLKRHLANDSSASYLKITPGTSASAALKQSDAVKHNKSFGEDLSNLGSFYDMYVKAGRIKNHHPKASTNEAYLGSWFIEDMALKINNDAHKPQRVAASLNKKQVTTMMKLFQMYFEVFNQDLVLMYDCLKIQGINITGLEAYRQVRECCHTTHTFSRDMNPRVIYYGSHHYNMSQFQCGRYPWIECTTCINKCVPRLHELDQIRFEKEIKLFMTIKAFTKMKNKSEEEVRKSLAEKFKEAFERVKKDGNDNIDVPEWITQQIENPTKIQISFFTCDICKKEYLNKAEAVRCETEHETE